MIDRMLYLRGLAILGPVLFHAANWGFIAMFWWTDRYLPVAVPNFDQMYSLSYFFYRAFEQFLMFSVPAFLFVSAYFSVLSYEKDSSAIGYSKIIKRVSRVFIPFIIWSLVYLLVNYLMGTRYSPAGALVTILTGRINEAYYFIPALIQFYLLLPILVPLAKKRWKALLVVSAILLVYSKIPVYVAILNPELVSEHPLLRPWQGWWFISHLFWFSLGLAYGFHKERFIEILERVKYWLLGLIIVVYGVGIIEWEYLLRNSGKEWIAPEMTLIDVIYIFLFLMTFLAFQKRTLPFTSGFKQLGAKSYGIYLIHLLALMVVARGIYHIAPSILGYQALFYSILVVSGFAVPILMMKIVEITPLNPYYQYLFGRK